MENYVYVKTGITYNKNDITNYLLGLTVFDEKIKPGDTVILKPNWVKEHHLKKNDWDYIITHPTIIESVVEVVAAKLNGKGKIIITDGPQTDSSFDAIMKHMNVDDWYRIAKKNNVEIQILDLRNEEWKSKEGVVIQKYQLKGDPKGSVKVNLQGEDSEFFGHEKSKKGYYGAATDLEQTNKAHDGYNNLYQVSRTVIEADVFINLPKLKTHKKAGITCCLKNLVGINTCKNFLPHHNEGTPDEGGDQFPSNSMKNRVEGNLMGRVKKIINDNTTLSKLFIPIKRIGQLIFGDTKSVVRSGNWYGNDTIWRTICDLNKVLFYANPDGTFKPDKWVNSKKYIGIVDGIKAGEGLGPMEPQLVESDFIVVGTNPLTIDCCCAKLMGFDYQKIPSLYKAFNIKKYKLFSGCYNDIKVVSQDEKYNKNLREIEKSDVFHFKPHFGWQNHIELD